MRISLITRRRPPSRGPPLQFKCQSGKRDSHQVAHTIEELLHHRRPNSCQHHPRLRFENVLTGALSLLPSDFAPVGVVTVAGAKGR